MNRPEGTVTFLFTDIEGSTKLWEAHPEAMQIALARHDALLRESIENANGYVFKTVGDAFCAAFTTATDALEATLAAQLALLVEPWPEQTLIKVRMALHTGAAESRDDDYFGQSLNRVARLLATGHGGQTILTQVTQELVRDTLPAQATLHDLGTHRLKDLARPEQIYQLQHPGLTSNFPVLKSLSTHPNNLPQQVTSFIGREKELAEVESLLEKTRLLTLTGAGGSGKSRLSLQAAADLLERFPDGAWLVEFAPLADPNLVAQTLAGVLNLKEEPGKPITQSLVEHLKSKRLLLVLDNCEHLLDACAKLADTLIRQCLGVHILASSREALGIAGELTYRVPSLSLPDPKQVQTPESLSQYEAVQLFIERALFQQSTFAVTNANAPALASICHRLDGIPLAIELAAARVRSLSIEDINSKLDQRFRLLTGGSRTALPRQQTLRSLIDWSYDLLSEAEKTLLCRLSVFAGGWTLDSAESVCSGDVVEDWEVLDLLTSLCDKSLVVSEPSGSSTRYRLLETIRQYSRDRILESGEEAVFRGCHLSHFLALGESAEPLLTGADQMLWLDRLELEHDNLRAALEWSGDSSSCLRLAGVIYRFWYVRGYFSEGCDRLSRALAEAAGADASLRAKALNGVGLLTSSLGDYPAARLLYEQSLAIAREVGDRESTARALGNLGLVAVYQGDYPAARVYQEESLAIRREMGDRGGIARALLNLGMVPASQGDYPAARLLYEQSLAIARELGNQGVVTNALLNLGSLASFQGDYASARVYQEESLAIAREVGNRGGIANALNGLGDVASFQGDYASARVYQEESLVIAKELGDRGSIANALNGLGNVAFSQGDYGSARLLYEESLAIKREIGDQKGIAYSLQGLGNVAFSQGDYGSAGGLYEESLVITREIGDLGSIPLTLTNLGNVASATGVLVLASQLWGAAERLREELGTPLSPSDQQEQDPQVAAARATLNDDAAFDAAWAEGRALTMEQAIELALGKQKVRE
ncbi:tetratricopeptide repeat protein [Armatimonas sp.]|uniref:tetratricopeptide repeat protein n=1 Tax=Armatimonas sp. TaxID=1872638 RepID=UPI00286B1355|nr:tetratricopeptide repeat protein [Armatimonas sp.]